MRLSLFALALFFSTPALAQVDATDSWIPTKDAVRVRAAGIALPQQAGSLSLVKTGEISDFGTGMNSYAQYASADNVIQATAFIYKPGFADTAITAITTERAILAHFGTATQRASQKVVAAGGHDAVALRTLYSGAADGELTLAAGVVRSGDWIVKLRVTATSDRKAEVAAALDAMLAGLSFDTPDTLQRAMPVTVATCTGDASGVANDSAFPRNGTDALCLRGTVEVGDARFDMLQSANAKTNGSVLIPTDDAGGLLRFDRVADGSGYQLTRYSLGASAPSGRYTSLPDATQMAAIINGSDQTSATQQAQSNQGTTTVLREPDNR